MSGLMVARKTAVVRFFFFQAEDGIRDYKVTGVQTCALPIYYAPKPGAGNCGRIGGIGEIHLADFPAGRRGSNMDYGMASHPPEDSCDGASSRSIGRAARARGADRLRHALG